MSFVLDNSVALTWCFEERADAGDHRFARACRRGRRPGAGALAARSPERAERCCRLDASRRQRLAGFLHALPISLDSETASRARTMTAGLAERFALSAYDAAYLELAQRHRLPLATLDRELRAAASALGLAVLGN